MPPLEPVLLEQPPQAQRFCHCSWWSAWREKKIPSDLMISCLSQAEGWMRVRLTGPHRSEEKTSCVPCPCFWVFLNSELLTGAFRAGNLPLFSLRSKHLWLCAWFFSCFWGGVSVFSKLHQTDADVTQGQICQLRAPGSYAGLLVRFLLSLQTDYSAFLPCCVTVFKETIRWKKSQNPVPPGGLWRIHAWRALCGNWLLRLNYWFIDKPLLSSHREGMSWQTDCFKTLLTR